MSALRDRYARGGQPPLGITRGPDGPEIHEQEAALVRQVFEHIALGLSTRRTAHAMEATHGEKWDAKTVRRMLYREVYVEIGLISPDLRTRAHLALQRNRRNKKGARNGA